MDIVSAFKSEIFRPVVTLVVPGFVAASPYLLVANYYNPQILEFWQASPSAFIGILLIIVLAVGLILEDIGSRIEVNLWDQIIKRKQKTYSEDWDKYLKLYTKDDIIGQRYLRTLLVRLKFELSMGPALFIALGGLIWFNIKCCIWTQSSCFWMSIAIAVAGAYLLWESYTGMKVLAKVRRLIIEAVQQRESIRPNEMSLAQQQNRGDRE